jgi:thiol:disulfide interchange protein DsbD
MGKYNSNERPFYVLVNGNEENLNKPVGYTPDVEEYLTWLKEGVGNYKK